MPMSFRTRLGDLEDSSCFASRAHGREDHVEGKGLS